MNDKIQKILDLKQKLLTEQLVEDSEYLTKYFNLLQANLETVLVQHTTQKHHALPVVYYKHFYPRELKEIKSRSRSFYDNLAQNDPVNFLVNLTYSDHLLAHCYLALCAKPNWFKFANANMIMVVSKYTNLEAFAALEDLSDYQKAYTLSCQLKHGKTLSEEHKAKIAIAHRKENMSTEYRQKLSEANRRRICTQETKTKISNSLKNNKSFQINNKARLKNTPPSKGLIWVSNGETVTRIDPSFLSDYLVLGYWEGRSNTLQIHKGYQEIIIHPRDWPLYEAQGWKKYWKLSKSDKARYTTNSEKEIN